MAASFRLRETSAGRGPFGRWKQVIGDELRAHKDECRATEVDVAVYTLNRMWDLGRPNYVCTA